MKTAPFLSILYGFLVFLSGFMDFQYNQKILALIIEVTFSLIILANAIFYTRYQNYILLAAAGLLIIFYCIEFALTHRFLAAILTAVSVLICILQLIKIFKLDEPPE